MTVHRSCLLNKYVKWSRKADYQRFFEGIKHILMQLLILAIADQDWPFHVVRDASGYAISCSLMQFDTDGAERVISYQSRQLQASDRSHTVHDK